MLSCHCRSLLLLLLLLLLLFNFLLFLFPPFVLLQLACGILVAGTGVTAVLRARTHSQRYPSLA